MGQTFTKIMSALLLAALMWGCAKKNSDDSSSVNSRAARGGGTPYNQYNPQQNNAGQVFYTAATGSIYSDQQYAEQFSQAIRMLLTAQLGDNGVQESVGRISINGVTFRGYVEVDQQGRLIPGKSSVSIKVVDEFAASGGLAPFYINLSATNGYAANGQADITFADNLGSVRFVGTYNANGKLTGNFSFQNTSNMHSGSNLSFQVDTCGFFRCQ